MNKMMMGVSNSVGQRINQRYRLVLAITMDPYLKLYEKFWDERAKHVGLIPKELLQEGQEISVPKYEREGVEFLADFLGGATLFADGVEIRGVLGNVRERAPIELKDDGLHYRVALTPTYGLVHNVEECQIKGATTYEMITRMPIPAEELDGTVGIIVAPLEVALAGAVRTYCPFLFTDFEVKDRNTKENFRKITAARQIGRLLDGQRGEEQLERLVAESLGVHEQYREWTDDVSRKTPFRDLKEVQERYLGVNLKNYLVKQPNSF